MIHACKYNIIRFQPYVETEEFANIGIMLFSVDTKELFFKLMPLNNTKRITGFFNQLDVAIFKNALQIAKVELLSLNKIIADGRYIDQTYNSFVAPTNDIVQYSNTRFLVTENPEGELDKLYDNYVQRNFIVELGHEERMQQRIKDLLRHEKLDEHYKERKLGREYFEVTLPFVNENKQNPKVIKPIHFMHQHSKKLMEHGLTWLSNMEQLFRNKAAKPENTLFVYKAPAQNSGLLWDAFVDIRSQIEDRGIVMTPSETVKPILTFATSD
ncbi:DUF3037 domain-containing protein [Thiolinea disciformis]|uniref:DUF3037 domain-containing protein n=1 Tax=Thiolinea disciformis TaxID=125614 RepID=UPI00036DDCD1|nr:DUF3037 domain-containing protein [Thiolinea disciformis]